MDEKELRAAADAYRRATDRADQARARRDAAIVAASKAGLRQRVIVEATGVTRETIRTIMNKARDEGRA